MRTIKALWIFVVLFVGLSLAWYSVTQAREATPWIFGAFAFYVAGVVATAIPLFGYAE